MGSSDTAQLLIILRGSNLCAYSSSHRITAGIRGRVASSWRQTRRYLIGLLIWCLNGMTSCRAWSRNQRSLDGVNAASMDRLDYVKRPLECPRWRLLPHSPSSAIHHPRCHLPQRAPACKTVQHARSVGRFRNPCFARHSGLQTGTTKEHVDARVDDFRNISLLSLPRQRVVRPGIEARSVHSAIHSLPGVH